MERRAEYESCVVPATRRARQVVLCALLVGGCASAEDANPPARSAVIDGDPAPTLSGIAHVAHVAGDSTCSGTLIAETLVLTAKHCAFRRAGDGDQLLPPEGFRVGFGASTEVLTTRSVVRVEWVGAPGSLDVDDAVALGEDVAVLQLSEPAPASETLRPVALAFEPVDQQVVRIAGFGLTDAFGSNGVRTLGTGRIIGAAPGTGVIEVSGDGACFGDSGGPVLSDDRSTVLGVISELGASDVLCDTGLTFASTANNDRVRRMLARECAAVGACGPRMNGSRDQDSGQEADPDDAGEGDAALDAAVVLDSSAPLDAALSPMSNASCSCNAMGAGLHPNGIAMTVAVAVAAFVRRRRFRVRAGREAIE